MSFHYCIKILFIEIKGFVYITHFRHRKQSVKVFAEIVHRSIFCRPKSMNEDVS